METTENLSTEIKRRKTFAIISHPDAGKTTLTEKLLLFGNAIHMAGVVKAKKSGQFATSDWMEIEKQRGISVTSSVMQFTYADHEINLLDTPGHADFSEDTYRVLTAVDSAIMVIDSSKGIETQTKRLFQVCRDRHIPIMTFMNKMDLEGRDPFELIDEVEKVLNLQCFAAAWPIGQGKRFHGVYDRIRKCIRLFDPSHKKLGFEQEIIESLDDQRFVEKVPEEFRLKLKEDLELLEAAGSEIDVETYLAGKSTPVFFGSGVNNFGVQELLDAFVAHAPSPRPRVAETRTVEPTESKFTGVVFKIQANMDPKHRDRCAFVRVCSGKFVPGMTLYHTREQKDFRINKAIQFLSQKRSHLDEAYAGDIMGVHDKNLIIGDTLTEGENLKFLGIPQFSPDIFCRVDLKNPIKIKQLQKGLEQLSEEGTSQLFRRKYNSDSILGVVGRLQLEVVKFRLLHEYSADAVFGPLPYTCSRWYHSENKKEQDGFEEYYRDHIVYDIRGYPVILFKNDWEESYVREKRPDIRFYSNLLNYEQDCLKK